MPPQTSWFQGFIRTAGRTMLIAGTLVVLTAGILFYRLINRAARILPPFASTQITRTFTQEISRLEATHGDILEVARLETVETFRQEDELKIYWGLLDLGKNSAEVRVPATYRYHIRLSDAWKLDTRQVDGVCVCLVRAPRLRPSLPVAFDTGGVEKRVERGWARFGAATQLADLEKGITPLLAKRAVKSTELARNHARKAIAEFVRAWLLREQHWSRDRFSGIKVQFADETVPIDRLNPTLELN